MRFQPRPAKRFDWLLLAVLLVAFALRLAYWERSASFGKYELAYDTAEYYGLGDLFAHREFFKDPFPERYVRAPGYSFFLAPILAASGPEVQVVLAYQVLVSVLMVAVIYPVTRRIFGKHAATWAMALLAIAPIYASAAGSFVFAEPLYTFLLLLFIYLFCRWTQERLTLARALLVGMLLGVTSLVRPTGVYFLPLALAWYFYQERARWRRVLPAAIVVALGMFLVILPYTARQFVTYQRFILIDTTGGWNLWGSHRTPNDDFWTTLPAIKNPGDRDRYAFQRGLQNMLNDPIHQIGETGIANLAATLHLESDYLARGAGYLADVMVDAPTLPLTLANDLYFLFVVITSIAGGLVFLSTSQRPSPLAHLLLIYLAYFLFITFVYHAAERYRTQFIFVLIVFASAALAQGRTLWQNLDPRARFVWLGASVVVVLLAYSPLLPPLFLSEYQIARAQGQDIPALQQATRADPSSMRAYEILGGAYRRAGDFTNALAAYDHALQLNPYEIQAQLGRIDVLRRQQKTEQLAAEISAVAGPRSGKDLPAALWWEFDPAPTRTIALGDSVSSYTYILNFYAIESDGDVPMRFTNERSFVKFPGILSWHPKTLVFSASAIALPNQAPPEVSVRVNGNELARAQITVGWHNYKIPLDDAARRNDTMVVEFRSPTFRPSERMDGSNDTRELGIMMRRVELKE